MTGILVLSLMTAGPEFAFAFSDAQGRKLLALNAVEDPERFTKASCGGTVFEVAFARLQGKGAHDNGRRTTANFSESAGALYEVKGPAQPDSSCLLATEAFFKTKVPKPVVASATPCDAKALAAVTALNVQPITRCTQIGRFSGGQILNVQFAPQGKAFLVGVVLLSAKTVAMRSFPASFEEGSPTCWRADDGCVFEPDAYRIPFVMVGRGIDLFALWGGPEGQELELLHVSGARLEADPLGASRSWTVRRPKAAKSQPAEKVAEHR